MFNARKQDRITLVVDDNRPLCVRDRVLSNRYCVVDRDRYPFQKDDKIVEVNNVSVAGLDADDLFQFMISQTKPYSVEVIRIKQRHPTFENPLYEPCKNDSIS